MKKPTGSRFVFCGLFAMALLFVTNDRVAFAQVSGSITGRVSDASGAGTPDANVTVTSEETGAARTAVSDSSGNYLVLSLPVGRYDIKVEKVGFRPSIQQGLDLVVGQKAVVNLTLEIGEVQQSITVTAEAPVVNTTTASIAGLVSEQEVKDLPLNGRSFDDLISLNPGAINYTSFSGTASIGAGAGNQFDVVGRRYEENLFLLNGTEYVGESNRSSQPGGASGQMLGIDAIREFNVMTDTYSAEYGKRPGAQVSVVTQSGGNSLHGTVFEFLRNSHLDARNYFDASPAQIGHRIPEFQRNQFGGALGGPVKRDKAFFFLNYEGFRQRLGLSDLAVVPDANARLGLLPNAQGVPTRVANLSVGMLPFFALWPQANGADLGGGVALNSSTPKESIREDFATVRFDQNLSPKDTLSEAYTVDDSHSVVPQTDYFFETVYSIRNQVGSIQEVHVFSSDRVNTFHFGYSRGAYKFNTPLTVPVPSNITIFAGLEPGQFNIGGGQTNSSSTSVIAIAGSASDYDAGVRNLFTYADDFQLIKGKHQVTFGAWFQRMDDNRQPGGNAKAAFSTLTTFLQGTVSNLSGGDPTFLSTPYGYKLFMGAWYVQDSIRLSRNLTLTAGLRHEFNNTLSEAHGQIANAIIDPGGFPETAPRVGSPFPNNYNKFLFAPRIALAWDVFGNGKTALRTGFGTYFSLPDNYNYLLPNLHPSVVYATSSSFLAQVPIQPRLANPCSPSVPTPCDIVNASGILTNKAATVEEWNLNVEQQVAAGTSLRLGYVGSHGYHEATNANLNSIPSQVCSNSAGCTSGGINKVTAVVPEGTIYVPVASTLPNRYISAATMLMNSYDTSYNALQVDVRHRMNHGLEFRGDYTWSKSLNVGTEPGGTENGNSGPQVMAPFDPRLDWGPSGSDVRNAASISGSYELPIGRGKAWLQSAQGPLDKVVSGWQVNSIVTLLGGFPFDTLLGSNQSGDGDTSNPDRPSWNPNFSGPVITGNPKQWFNPSAFIIPASGTFGNVGKNDLRGPGLADWDLSLFKSTLITENTRLEFRAEFFNLLNHVNFSYPNKTVFSGTSVSPTAGLITATATTSRQIQFGLKFVF